MDNTHFDAIIVGGGLAGLSSGLHLSEAGLSVLLLEARQILGGRTASWNEDGMEIESGFHRHLGFYEAFPDLLEKAGVEIDDIVIWTDEAEIRLPNDEGQAVFGLSPVHNLAETLMGVLLNNAFIDPIEKAKLTAFFAKGFYLFGTDPQELDRYTVPQMAMDEGLQDQTITRILVPLTEGLFFLPIEEYSALSLFGLFAPFLPRMHKMRVGAYNGGMSDVIIAPLAEQFRRQGGVAETDSPVTRLVLEDDRVAGVLTNGEIIRSEAVVLATSVAPAQELLEAALPGHPFFADFLTLETMPSVTVQIELTEPATPHDRVFFSPTTVLASYTEESRTTFPQSSGRLSTILAHPEEMLERSEEQLLAAVLRDARKLDLNVDADAVIDYSVVSWENDFYSYKRGTYEKRPPQVTPVEGLFLAGDYTKQAYLQTMEGAVVSGQLAADGVLRAREETSNTRVRPAGQTE